MQHLVANIFFILLVKKQTAGDWLLWQRNTTRYLLRAVLIFIHLCKSTNIVTVTEGISVTDCRQAGKTQKQNFFYNTFTTVFKICLHLDIFDSSVCPHGIFWWHFSDSPELLKNNFCQWTWFNFIQVYCDQIVVWKFSRICKVPSENSMSINWWIKMCIWAYF